MPLGSGTSRSRGTGGGFKTKKKGFKLTPQIWIRILYWGLVASGFYFGFLNIQPYAQSVKVLAAKSVSSEFINLVAAIPIINGIALILGSGIIWIIGAILWGVIQIIEVLPLILYNHESFLKTVISNADSRSTYHVKDTDDPTLRFLKRTYNALPTSVITNLEILKILTYTADFLICTTVYSPVESGNVIDFFWVLGTGQWGKVAWDNLALCFVTLFAIEIIVSLIVWLGKLAYAVKQSK